MLERFDKGRIVPRRRERPAKRTQKRVFFVLGDPSATSEPLALEDSAAVQAIADPFRLKLLRLLSDPTSAREMAANVGRPVTSLYHHLDLLEQHGLITVFDVRQEGRTFVRRYVRAADRFEAAGDLAPLGQLVASLDESAGTRRVQLTRRIAAAVTSALDDANRSDVRLRLFLRGPIDPERLDELGARLESVIAEYFDDAQDTTFEVAVTAAPATKENER